MRLKILALVLILIAPASFAATRKSSTKGTIKGVVTGNGSGPLGGVRVYLLQSADRTPVAEGVTTDFEGKFTFVGIRPGSYTVRASLFLWQEKFLDGVQVQPAGTASLNIELEPQPPSFLFPAPEPQIENRSTYWGYTFGDVDLREMPTNRTVWSLLENQGLPTVGQTLDTGQIEAGTPSPFGIHGDSWTENQYLFNGFDASDPYITGQPLIDPDYAALSTMTEVIGAKPANFATSGVNLLLETPRPRSAFHGQTGLYFSDHALQSSNQTSNLIDVGFPGSERLNHLYDANAQLGGGLPLGSFSLPVFAAFSTQQVSKTLGGFPATINAHTDHILAEVTPYQRGGRRLDLLYAAQQQFNSRAGAFINTAPSAASIRNDNFHQLQARFRDTLGAKSFWQAGFGAVHAILSSGLETGDLSTSTLDLPDRILTGSAPLARSGRRTRYEGNTAFHTIFSGFGSHALGIGADFDVSTMSNRWFSLTTPGVGAIQQITVDGAASEVIQWNAQPATAASARLGNFSLFAEDSWRLPFWSRRLAFSVGARLEYSAGRTDGIANRIHWTTLEPRAGVAISLPHNAVARLGWSRYGHQLQGQYFDYGNPNSIGGRVLAWDDSNHDGIAQSSELGQVLRVFGGPFSGIAPGLRRPYTDEFDIGLEGFVGKFQVRARGFLRWDKRLIAAVDTGVPLSSYTPVVVADPGLFPFGGDHDFFHITVFNENPAALGHDFVTLGNFPGYDATSKGFDLELTYRSGGRWEAQASFAQGAVLAVTFPPSTSVFSNDTGVLNLMGNDPNTNVNNPGLTYFDRGQLAKFQLYYNLPFGIHTASVIRWTDGIPYSPLLFVTGFNQGPFLVRAVPDQYHPGFHTEFISTVDFRVSRKFPLRRGNLEAFVDIFNLLNLHSRTLEREISDALLTVRLPLTIQTPRTARIGAEWRF